jgi:hypothetical protein
MKCQSIVAVTLVACVLASDSAFGAEAASTGVSEFPRALDSYGDSDIEGVLEILLHRIQQEPFNLVLRHSWKLGLLEIG